MDDIPNNLMALKEVIEAQQDVIHAWEGIFESVEGTIINLVKANIDLKIIIIRQKEPDFVLPENMYDEMDELRANYLAGKISPLAYFEGLDIVLSQITL